MPFSQIKDAELWEEILNGDKKCFQILFEKQYRSLMLFGLGVRADKELIKDMIQELFLEVWKKRNQLPKVEKVSAYLKQILKRKILKKLSKESKFQSNKQVDPTSLILSYEALLIQQENKNAIHSKLLKAFQQLTPKQKEIIQLRFYEGLSYEEIAEKNHTQKRTIYNQVHSAIKILKKYMLLYFFLLFIS